jgi:hypothetical protein
MLPKINSLRSKTITLNGKKIVLKPWTNIQLTTYEENMDSKDYNLIFELLIKDNVETKHTLTLIERRYCLYELYMLSKGNLLDIQFTCISCENPSQTTLDISKIVNYKEIKERTIKTKNFVMNLKSNSSYCIDLEKDINIESIKYAISFIDSFIYKDETYESLSLDEMVDWFIDEVESEDFDDFVTQITNIQPSMNVHTEVNCAHCGTKNKITMDIERFLV